jgi:hypothetical protein
MLHSTRNVNPHQEPTGGLHTCTSTAHLQHRLMPCGTSAASRPLQLAGMSAQAWIMQQLCSLNLVIQCFNPACCACAAALFWAEFATHLATKPEQPFIPSDPTGVPASTAAIIAALAVVGLPCKGAPTSSNAATAAAGESPAARMPANMPAQAGVGGYGCTRSYAGSTLTLTATSACLLWVKQVNAAASISAAAAAQASAAGAAAAAPAGLISSTSSSSASTALVAERLFDPRFAATTDPETGEQLLLSLQPSEQQPLLAGQAYCRSVVITSTGPSEQQLDILLQVGCLLCTVTKPVCCATSLELWFVWSSPALGPLSSSWTYFCRYG